MINWKPLVRECLQSVKESTDKADKNAVAGFSNGPYCKEEVVGDDCIHIYASPSAIWTSLQLGNALTMEINTDWNAVPIFIFMDLKRSLNRRKNGTTKIKENLRETAIHYLKRIQIS